MNIDLRAKWAAVRAETPSGEGARRALPDKSVPVYVTCEAATGRLGLRVVLPGGRPLRGLPKWQEVDITQHRKGDDTVVHLRLETSTYEAIFAAVAEDVVDSLRGEPQSRWRVILANRIQFWRQFFRERGFQGLNRRKQRGLYAELVFLRDHALPRLGAAAVTRWAGPEAMPQDFLMPSGLVEVKASSPEAPGRVRINGVGQLDGAGRRLLLHVVNLDGDEGGETLSGLVASIRATLSGGELRALNTKLLQAGYLDVHEGEYQDLLSVAGEATYDVRDGFPRLTEAPPEVVQVRYDVDVSGATAFLVGASAIDGVCQGGS